MMKLREWMKPKRLLFVFLCVELLALCLGGRAFYANPMEISIGGSAPYYDLAPVLPPQEWSMQRQWFTAGGGLLNRIIFSVVAGGERTGGFTVNIRDEAGTSVIAQHYAGEELSEGFLVLDIQKTIKYGARYCFEVVADEGGSDWSVPCLYVPGGELSWLEEAFLDGAPMGGGLHYMFLSLYFARINGIAIFLHILAAITGAAYLFLLHAQKGKTGFAAEIAALCAAGACAAGQFLLCKNYYFSRTLLLCMPGAFVAGLVLLRVTPWNRVKIYLRSILKAVRLAIQTAVQAIRPAVQAIPWDRVRARFRLSIHSWKSCVFMGAVLLSVVLTLLCEKEQPLPFSSPSFKIAAVVFLVFLFLGVFSTPKLDRFLIKCPWLIYGTVSGLIFLQMEIANANPFEDLKFNCAVWNIVTIFSVLAVLWALFGNFHRAGIAGTALFAVWGIANYLTVDFRGIPIAPNDLMSAGTALNVLGSYQLTLKMDQVAILQLIFLEILLVFRIPSKDGKGKRLLLRSAALICIVLFFWQGYFENRLPFSMAGWQWYWPLGYYPQGYVGVSVSKIRQLLVTAPAGYSSAEVQILCEAQCRRISDAQAAGDLRPDIILILNESWFDWRQVTEFETDKPVTPFIDSLENCVKGYAVGPQDRSGTSLSEYELLTSNSLSMLPGITPFTQRSLEGSCSVVSYLEALGYTTAAMHPAPAKNYNRGVAYPQLGFDSFYFDDDGLFGDALYIHGYLSDRSAFDAVKNLFAEKGTDNPKLIYLLTLQNHGGYDQTEKTDGIRSGGIGEYTIHLESGFDEVQNAAEEYLSIIRCTDAAFEELLRGLENCGEPTIVCMVGDHGPPLGGNVASPYEGYEWSMRQRGTPFVIWANYPIQSDDVGYIGMVQLAPLLMETAGLPLSPYYRTILDLSEEYPVLSAAFYQDANGSFGDYSYTEEIPQSALLRQYFYFEYNSLLSKEKQIEQIFLAG